MKSVARLLDQIKPTRYALELTPNLETFTFTGREVIECTLEIPSNQLTFHANELTITSVSANGSEGTITLNSKDQTVTFSFEHELADAVSIEIIFSGELKEKLHGFYRSSYKDEAGKTRWLATTQFEPTAAREAFICIDEPAAKAVFDVTLTIPEDMEAISNTNIVEEKAANGKKTITFAPTPKMSTYLLAFLVGNFERISTTTKNGVEVGVYTTAGKQHQGQFALETAAKILDFYTNYFGIPYPLPKLDMIAVPDFSAGAMENWGAVTYREPAILVDPKNTATANKQLVAMVVAHELAHQWFGNLVTMGWWTDLWLNEGFASWVEFLAVDNLFPEWEMWTQFVSNDYAQARQLDALANTHPIEIEVHHPDEIGEIFDTISYSKGASVIRMLYHYLGEDDFKKGLNRYLETYSYSNATTDNLWEHLEKASNKPVIEVMQKWTKQPGFPLVTLRDGTITQERFYADPKQPASDSLWPIPLSFLTPTGTSTPILVDHHEGSLGSDNTGWEKPNANQTGFYLVNYSATQLAQLQAVLPSLPTIDRYGIVSDVAMLLSAGKLSSDQFLSLIAALRDEGDYAVWMAIFEGLGALFVLADDKTLAKLEAFTIWLLEPSVARLGWEPKPSEPHLDTLLRSSVLGLAGRCGYQEVIEEARKRFARYLESKELAPDLRVAIYSVVARHGDTATYRQFTELLEHESLQEEQRRLLSALARFKDPDLLQQTLKRSLSDKVRTQDSVLAMLAVLANRFGRQLTWQFIQDNWQLLVDRYGQGGHMLSRIPDQLGMVFARHELADELETFFNTHDKPGIERSIQQALESIRLQADWWERDKDSMNEFLDSSLSR